MRNFGKKFMSLALSLGLLVSLTNVPLEARTLGNQAQVSYNNEDGDAEEEGPSVEEIVASDEEMEQADYNVVFEDEANNLNISGFVSIPDGADAVKDLESGSVLFRYRADDPRSGLAAVFSVSDADTETNYAAFYINLGAGQVGVEMRSAAGEQINSFSTSQALDGESLNLNNTYWHTIVYTYGENGTRLYVDGNVAYADTENSSFFSAMDSINTISVGGLDRAGSNWKFVGGVDRVAVYDQVLTPETVREVSASTAVDFGERPDDHGFETSDVFFPGLADAPFYRIPALLQTADGTLIAAAEERNAGLNTAGDINTVIRRRPEGETEFEDPITVIDLPELSEGSTYAAYTSSPSLVQVSQGDNEGRIYMLLTGFPDRATTTTTWLGDGYVEVDGETYLALYDEDDNEYTVREEGVVYDSEGNVTEYTMTVTDEAPFNNLGNISVDGEVIGNAFVATADGSNYFEIRAEVTTHLLLTHSDDDGLTWSQPVDLSVDVKNDEFMMFLGAAPGQGIELESGRLVFPVYFTDNYWVRESAAVIFSDDGGETWAIGESPNDTAETDSTTGEIDDKQTTSQVVQLNDGTLLLFMSNDSGEVLYAVSSDEGETWDDEVVAVDFVSESATQLSAIHYEEDGTEYVILSNPRGLGNGNGSVKLLQVGEGNVLEVANDRLITPSSFQNSALVDLGDGNIGLTYEQGIEEGIAFRYLEFPFSWLTEERENIYGSISLENPVVESAEAVEEDGSVLLNLTFNNAIFNAADATVLVDANGNEIEATYVSGTGTNTLSFDLGEDALGEELNVLSLSKRGYIEDLSGASVTGSEDELELGIAVDAVGESASGEEEETEETEDTTDETDDTEEEVEETETDSTTTTEEESEGLSGGLIAGIVAGAVAIIGAVGYFISRNKGDKSEEEK